MLYGDPLCSVCLRGKNFFFSGTQTLLGRVKMQKNTKNTANHPPLTSFMILKVIHNLITILFTIDIGRHSFVLRGKNLFIQVDKNVNK